MNVNINRPSTFSSRLLHQTTRGYDMVYHDSILRSADDDVPVAAVDGAPTFPLRDDTHIVFTIGRLWAGKRR